MNLKDSKRISHILEGRWERKKSKCGWGKQVPAGGKKRGIEKSVGERTQGESGSLKKRLGLWTCYSLHKAQQEWVTSHLVEGVRSGKVPGKN